MFSIAAQNRTLFGVAPFTPRCYSWRVCPTSDSPPDGVPEGRLQEDEAQRCAAEGKARCTFFGLSKNEQILRTTKQLSLPLAALGASKTCKEEFKTCTVRTGNVQIFLIYKRLWQLQWWERAFLRHRSLVTLHTRLKKKKKRRKEHTVGHMGANRHCFISQGHKSSPSNIT